MFNNPLNENIATQQSLQEKQLNTVNTLINTSKDIYENSKQLISRETQHNKQQQSNTLFSVRLVGLFFLLVILILYGVMLALKYNEGLGVTINNNEYKIFNIWKSTLDFSLVGSLLLFMIFLISDSSKPEHHYDFRQIRIKIWWNLTFWCLTGGSFIYFVYKKIVNDDNQLVLGDWFYYLLFIIILIIQITFWFIFISNKSLLQYELTRTLRQSQKKLQQNDIKNAKKREKALIASQKRQNNQSTSYRITNDSNKKLSRNERKKQKLEQKISKLQTDQPKTSSNLDELF